MRSIDFSSFQFCRSHNSKKNSSCKPTTYSPAQNDCYHEMFYQPIHSIYKYQHHTAYYSGGFSSFSPFASSFLSSPEISDGGKWWSIKEGESHCHHRSCIGNYWWWQRFWRRKRTAIMSSRIPFVFFQLHFTPRHRRRQHAAFSDAWIIYSNDIKDMLQSNPGNFYSW